MDSIIEAIPEIVIACIVAGLFYLLTKDKLSASARNRSVLVFAALVLVWLIMLAQSDSVPAQLHVEETSPDYQQPLAEIQDTSPKTLSAEESSARLEALREAQKENTSLEPSSDASELDTESHENDDTDNG
ncbi:hypothetical protein [Planctobacterium marinum]